jgi:hypothetical protein
VTQGLAGKEVPTGVVGKVVGVSGAENKALVRISFNGPIAAGDTLTIYAEPRVARIDRVKEGGRPITRDYVLLPTKRYVLDALTISSRFTTGPIYCLGALAGITVNVAQPFQGRQRDAVTLRFIANYASPKSRRLEKIVNLSVAGIRKATTTDASGWKEGDSVGEAIPGGALATEFMSSFWFSASAIGDGQESPPIVSAEVQIQHPLLR